MDPQQLAKILTEDLSYNNGLDSNIQAFGLTWKIFKETRTIYSTEAGNHTLVFEVKHQNGEVTSELMLGCCCICEAEEDQLREVATALGLDENEPNLANRIEDMVRVVELGVRTLKFEVMETDHPAIARQ